MSQQIGDVRALVEQIAKALVDEPDQVSVNQIEGDVLELKVAPNDVGRVIGAKGRVARALRALIGAAGIRLHKRFTLEILE
jgi:predicted RNA-binding protein YlqC (UPF0109 family)